MTEQECTNRNIPLPIQREVRQRCGFGCVVCGLPLYEYEHMMEWAKVRRHVAEEITLLCDQHHREKTSGLLPKEQVTAHNKNPYNLRDNIPKPYTLHFSGHTAKVVLGGNSFTCEDKGPGTVMHALIIDNLPIVSFVLLDGHVLLTLLVFNEYNQVVLHIKNNHLFYATLPWDIQLIGTTLIIREEHRKVLMEIEFSPPNLITINRGRFIANGVEVLIRPSNLLITNNRTILSRSQAINCYAGLMLGRIESGLVGMMAVPNIPRYNFDRTAALEFEKESLEADKYRETRTPWADLTDS